MGIMMSRRKEAAKKEKLSKAQEDNAAKKLAAQGKKPEAKPAHKAQAKVADGPDKPAKA